MHCYVLGFCGIAIYQQGAIVYNCLCEKETDGYGRAHINHVKR